MGKQAICKLLHEIRTVSPIGTTTVFVAAYLAFLIGHFAALVIVAFLVGLHLAKQQTAQPAAQPANPLPAAKVAEVLAPQPSSPIADALANGLTIRKIEFSQAAAPKKNNKQTVSAA